VKGRNIPKRRFSAIYSLLISYNHDDEKIPVMKLSTNSTKSLNKCEVTFMSQHKRLKAKQSKNEGKNVSISELLTQQGTNLRQLNANRKGTTISLVRPGQSVQVFNCFAHQKSLEPLAASSMTITCAKIWRRWGRIIL
jgi:hypothetical protein